MKLSKEIHNELKEISSFLAGIEKINVFSVPEGYFSALSSQVLQNIKDGEDDTLPESERPNFSDVPEGYFESLPGIILNKIRSFESDNPAKELKQLSPMLYALQSENVFSVPRGYFINLPANIVEAVKPKSKVIPLKKHNRIWDYAVAAMLAGVMAVSALLIDNNSSKQNIETAAVPPYIKEAGKYKSEEQISKGIAALTDDDIINYLEKTGNSADDQLLSTVVREKELPDEKDYLLDENTLETFLHGADKTGQN
jgi:hypothetical protein